jgi:ABC-type dipeptide/oligopeptide/nickel transport system permease component
MIFCLAIGSGVFYDFYLLLSNSFDNILNKDYSIFARILGYKPYKFARKELIINTASIIVSRLPILFGGMIIIEVFTKGTKNSYSGAGLEIFRAFHGANIDYEMAFLYSVVCVFIFSFFFFFSEFLGDKFGKGQYN